jgi:hypothetical protein
LNTLYEDKNQNTNCLLNTTRAIDTDKDAKHLQIPEEKMGNDK